MSSAAQDLKSLYLLIAKAITDRPQELSVRVAELPSSISIIIDRCSPNDYGKILGFQRRMLDSCELILQTAGKRAGKRVHLFLERVNGQPLPEKRYAPKLKWTREESVLLCERIRDICYHLITKPVRVTITDIGVSSSVVCIEHDPGDRIWESNGLAASLSHICVAMGRQAGRNLTVDVVANESKT